jgi:hypothetical protein
MQLRTDYFAAYRSLRLTRDGNGVLVAEFHTKGVHSISQRRLRPRVRTTPRWMQIAFTHQGQIGNDKS